MTQPSLPLRIAQGLHKIGLALRSREREGAAGRGLSPAQSQILALLRRHGPSRLTRIAGELAVTAATASDAVAALESKRLVTRRPDPRDARAALLRLTPAGRRAADAASHWPNFLTAAVDALAPAEQEAFHRALIKMIRALQERGQIPIARMCVGCRFFRPHAHKRPSAPHHCDYVDAPFGDRDLRLDCPDFEPTQDDSAWRAWVSLASLAVVGTTSNKEAT